MPTRTKSNTVKGKYWNIGGTVWDQPVITVQSDTEVLSLSSGHYGYPDFPSDRNVGGAFTLSQKFMHYGVTDNQRWSRTLNPANTVYDGIFSANMADLPTTGFTSILDGSSRAAEAYRKMKPTKPIASYLNSIVELRDIPHMLSQLRDVKSAIESFRGLGNLHLGIQFGWFATVRDAQNIIKAQRELQKRVRQLLRDNGKPVRRRITLADAVSDPVITTGTSYGALAPTLATQFYATQPTWRQTDWTTDRIWASARFRYWLPPGPRDIDWTRNMLGRIYGLKPTPSVLYNAIPWSWLVDWFSNLGDTISNLEAGVADRLAADYFYVMRERTMRREYNVRATLYDYDLNRVKVDLTSYGSRVHKTRILGDPFGWQTSENNLSAMQLSILGALGLSRLR
jgi:hypothetical protein